MDSTSGLEIEVAAYNEFFGLWDRGMFEKQRLGQAFYSYFRLHRLIEQASLFGLYEANGEKALVTISCLFQIKYSFFLKGWNRPLGDVRLRPALAISSYYVPDDCSSNVDCRPSR